MEPSAKEMESGTAAWRARRPTKWQDARVEAKTVAAE
jgi:hypothetical protein